MRYVALECPRCAAALPARSSGAFHCPYCATPLVPERTGFRVLDEPEPLEHPERARFWLSGTRYMVLGRIGRGEACDVFLASRDHRLGERVIAKVLRAPEDADLLAAEWLALTELQRSEAAGSHHFSRLLPQPVAHGEARLGVRGDEGSRLIAVVRAESGYAHTFTDVRASYPGGIPASASVWLWKRVLELLGFVHASGWVHGGLLPRHLLVHARDHGVRLCGWSCATRVDGPIAAWVDDAAPFYPRTDGDPRTGATAARDVAMSARSVLWLLGGDPLRAPSSTPPPLAQLLEQQAAEGGEASQVLSALDRAAGEAFGPPKFVPFPLPGWAIA